MLLLQLNKPLSNFHHFVITCYWYGALLLNGMHHGGAHFNRAGNQKPRALNWTVKLLIIKQASAPCVLFQLGPPFNFGQGPPHPLVLFFLPILPMPTSSLQHWDFQTKWFLPFITVCRAIASGARSRWNTGHVATLIRFQPPVFGWRVRLFNYVILDSPITEFCLKFTLIFWQKNTKQSLHKSTK